jgi:hypothetical protein
MWFSELYRRYLAPSRGGRRRRAAASPRCSLRPRLEQLEGRLLPSTYYAAGASDLIADIKAANKAGGINTIVLSAPTTSPYVLTAVDNTTDGATGLPVIGGGKTAVNLTIVGNGDTIERSTASGTPAFRLFDVAGGSSLSLQNLTLANGLAYGSGTSAEGGAIYNQGTLSLSGVTVQNNTAQGAPGRRTRQGGGSGPLDGQPAEGGGIWSNGTLTLQSNTLVKGNSALGGAGGGNKTTAGRGAVGVGGGLSVVGGTVNIMDTTLSGNIAAGGAGGVGGNYPDFVYGTGGYGRGGGLLVAGGSLSLTNDVVANNTAQASAFGDSYGGGIYVGAGTLSLGSVIIESNSAYSPAGSSYGGGLYVGGGTVDLDNVTVEYNTATGDLGTGLGGGIFVGNGGTTVELCTVTVEYNTAKGFPGTSRGGGLYIAGATVYLDPQTTVTNNTADLDPDIDGSYTLQTCP